MRTEPMEPYGRALLDYNRGKAEATLIIQRDDGLVSELPIASFFREPPEFFDLERIALDNCRGPVLDAGAGAGCHSLVLQERGITVTAIDIASQAVEIMSDRGVIDARQADAMTFTGGPFATILILGRSIGMVGTLSGLDRYLLHARSLLEPDGQIILNSLDVRQTSDPVHLAYQEANRQAGRYEGEIRFRFEYDGCRSDMFSLLHVDAQTLAEKAGKAGFVCKILYEDQNGDYLVRLKLAN